VVGNQIDLFKKEVESCKMKIEKTNVIRWVHM